MKTLKIKHINGPSMAIVSLWNRYTTHTGDVIEVNETEWETLSTKMHNENLVFEIVKIAKQEKNETLEG
jgi:hypothetical protein